MTYSVYSLNFSNLFPQQSEYLMTITLYFLLSIGWTLISMAWFVIYNQLVNRSDIPAGLDSFCRFLQERIWRCCRRTTSTIDVQKQKESRPDEVVSNDAAKKCHFCQRCSSCQADHDKAKSKTTKKKEIESKYNALNKFVLFCITVLMLASNLAIWMSMSE